MSYREKEGHGRRRSCGKTEVDGEAWLSNNPHMSIFPFRSDFVLGAVCTYEWKYALSCNLSHTESFFHQYFITLI
jgi:hypothetical protein